MKYQLTIEATNESFDEIEYYLKAKDLAVAIEKLLQLIPTGPLKDQALEMLDGMELLHLF